MTVFNRHGETLRAAHARGIDPETVELQDAMQGVAPKKIKEQSGQNFSSYTTLSPTFLAHLPAFIQF
jgi:hypothetical protein